LTSPAEGSRSGWIESISSEMPSPWDSIGLSTMALASPDRGVRMVGVLDGHRVDKSPPGAAVIVIPHAQDLAIDGGVLPRLLWTR
jgi:hypothetical protein